MDLQHPTSSESCRSSMVDQDGEVTLETPRTRHEVQEVMKETEWKEARGGEEEEESWRLSQKGKWRCRRPESLRMGSKALTWTIVVKVTRTRARPPKNKSEETQDCVREANVLNQEEGEETSFVPSATSVPQKLTFRCDNQCSAETLSFWQLALVVIREGEESYTTNLCQNCYNDSLKAKGEKTPTNWQWREFAGQKAHR